MREKTGILIACCAALWLMPGGAARLAAQASQAASVSFQDSENELAVTVGKTVLIDCRLPIARVAVGLGDVAKASVITPTEIMVDGKTAGETSLIIWDIKGGRQFFNVRVQPSVSATETSLDGVRRELRTELPGQTLKVTSENGIVYLRGTVKDLTSSQRAVQIAATAGRVVNLLNVMVPKADPQILLKVRFASVDRSKANQLGINLYSLGLGNTVGGISTGQFSPPSISSSAGSSGISGGSAAATFSDELNFLAYFPGLNAGADIKALETKGVVEVLAEPNLLATNGKQASFLAGGEYPYPVVQAGSGGGSASVAIEFKEYGVRLNFIPTITPRGTIRLQVAPEVSSLDFSNAVEVSGFNVPAISTRKVKTEVELADGQTFIIGGLLDNRETETFEKIPFLGDIPVLGKFFQSTSKNRTNTELIVVVTTEFVAPMAAGTPTPSLKYPVKFLPPNSDTPMHTPDAKTAANTPAPPEPAIPVESLIDSMKPETPLVIDAARGGFGAPTGASATSTTAPAGAAGAVPSP